MKIFRIFGRNIRDALKSVFRNFSLSLASISCITITLLIVSISLILSYNVKSATKSIKEDFTIVVFIQNSVTEERIEEIKTELYSFENIESYEYQNKVEIANEMKNTSDVFKTIIEGWSEDTNPLQDIFLIKVVDSEKITATAEDLEGIVGVDLVRYGEGMVESLLSVFKYVDKALIIAIVSLILVTAFLISNTIKLTIFSRKREIEIMRLVGASNMHIKMPFVIEGSVLGVLGSVLPIIFVIYGYSKLFTMFNGEMFTPIFKLVQPVPFIYAVSLFLLGVGILVGMVGSARAVRKYLKI